MSKYLFTDGSGIHEISSAEELEKLVSVSPEPASIRVWIFDTSEWISYAAFRKTRPVTNPARVELKTQAPPVARAKAKNSRWLKRSLYLPLAVAGLFLVVNFTRIKWEKAPPVSFTATRPANVPVMDIDSLINEIEYARGTLLDKSTRTNLRLRNDWTERIGLTLRSAKQTSSAGSRFFNIDIGIDNATGFDLDNAIVRLSLWKSGEQTRSDTLRFNTIRYDKVVSRRLDEIYKGDSISVSFESIRARSFNFCYSASTKNNSGNYNDRWFCRDQ